MVPVIGSVKQALLVLGRFDGTSADPGRPSKTGEKMNAPKDGVPKRAQADESRVSFRVLQSVKDGLNSAAGSIRIADTTMGAIGTAIESMKEKLLSIVKNYPPYPPGSEERIAYLNSFNALRSQIDRLIASSGDAGAREILADPGGLNIPSLDPSTATDAEIEAALTNLDAAGAEAKSLDVRRELTLESPTSLTEAHPELLNILG